MLTGQPLGQAIDAAIKLKGVPKTSVAAHFGIKGPSIYDWINHGRVSKKHLQALFDYFSDVVGPEHWGLDDSLGPSQRAGLDTSMLGVALTSMDQVIRGRGLRMEGQLGRYAPVLAIAYEAALIEFPSGPPSPETRSGKAALRAFDKKVDEWLGGGIADGTLGPIEDDVGGRQAGPGRGKAERKAAGGGRK